MILVIAPIDQRTRIKDKTTSPSDNACMVIMIPVTKRKKIVYGPLFSSKIRLRAVQVCFVAAKAPGFAAD